MTTQVIIPAAGVEKKVQITGKTVLIPSMPIYQNFSDVPRLGFDGGKNNLPLFPTSRYQFDDRPGCFNNIVITGTEASEGGVINLFSVKQCLGTKINIQLQNQYESILGATFGLNASDAAQTLIPAQVVDANGNKPIAMYVLCAPLTGAERGIKYAQSADPIQGKESLGKYLGDDGYPLKIEGYANILNWRWIAETTGETPLVNFTMEYYDAQS